MTDTESIRQARLQYGTFVSLVYRYVYFEVPKAAATSLKWLIHEIENLPDIEPSPLGHRETKKHMFIHDRSLLELPSADSVDDISAILADPTWFRFAVVRNPYSRLVAAWANKVRWQEPENAEHETLGAGLVSFSEFLSQVMESDVDSPQCNSHWQSQTSLLLKDSDLQCFEIFKTEHLSGLLVRWHQHLQQNGFQHSMPELARLNRSNPLTRSWWLYYDETMATAVQRKYEHDFELFHYDRDGWQRGRDGEDDGTLQGYAVAADVSLGDVVDFFESEIRQRNETIDWLYDEIAKLVRKADG